MEISNKIAVVTGATSGIGLATAKMLEDRGAKVVLVSKSKEKLEKVSEQFKNCYWITTDMGNMNQIQKMVEEVIKHFKKIDILINNAGFGYDASIEKTDLQIFKKLINVELLGPFKAMQLVIPYMKNQMEGAIINISSGTALMALPNMGAYSSVKRALVGISLTANEELKKFNIHTGVVFPYITESDFEKNTIKEKRESTSFSPNEKPFYPPDSSEYVAKLICDAITGNKSETYAHEWMQKMKK